MQMDNLMLRSRDREIEYQGNLGYIEKQNGKDVITEHTNPEPAQETLEPFPALAFFGFSRDGEDE